DVDFAEALERGRTQFFKRSAVTHIRAQAHGVASSPLDLGRCLVDVFLAPPRGDDIGSSIGEAKAQNTPDPGGASDYDCRLAFEAKDIGHHSFVATIYIATTYRGRPRVLTLDWE